MTDSLSPAIYNMLFKLYGMKEHTYESVNVADQDEFSRFIYDTVKSGEYAGLNITAPFKTYAYYLCNQVDEAAELSKSVNTIIIRDGVLYGYDTDGLGHRLSTRIRNTPHHIAIFGSGGAARSILAHYSSVFPNTEFTIVARNEKKATRLTEEFPFIQACSFDRADAIADADIIINTLPCSLKAHLASFPNLQLVSDIVYNPLKTTLISQAMEAGIPTHCGIDMLYSQIRLNFKEFFGIYPELDIRSQLAVGAQVNDR